MPQREDRSFENIDLGVTPLPSLPPQRAGHPHSGLWVGLALCGALWATACESATAGGAADTTAEDAAAEPADSAASDSVPADSNDAVGPDTSTGDAGGSDGGPTDAAPADSTAGEGVVVNKGCKGDGDCANLVLTSCQSATCALSSGLCQVQNLPDAATCTGLGQDACKVEPRCKSGKCTYSKLSCDDGNGCTADACDPVTGCTATKIAGGAGVVPCSDGSACTLAANCLAGVCTKIKGLECDDKQPCTTDSCDSKAGCVYDPLKDGQSCSDGKYCSEKDSCKKGVCTGAAVVCPDDGKPCTVAACAEPAKGCSTAAVVDILCDDGLPCTTGDSCSAAGECAGQLKDCEDKNPCTDDTCDAVQGCLHKNNTLPCTGDACISGGQCKEGKCEGTEQKCNDGNFCTQDLCDSVKGCQAKPWPSPCWDGNVCTLEDTCEAGVCKGGGALQCADANPCTVDACDPVKGCSHLASSPGASCGSGKTCSAGLCLASSCGDGWCSSEESAGSCAKDCPEDGGACAPNDAACLGTCAAAKCKPQGDACASTDGCAGIGPCLASCGTDLGCSLKCLVSAPGTAAEVFGAHDQCMQAFCVKDFWIGKKCTGAGNQYVQCVDACEGAMCKSLALQCKASTGCTLIRDCLKTCTQADPVPCLTSCKAKGTVQDALLNAGLDDCDKSYCL